MPIRPEDRHLYGRQWKELRQSILARAQDHCEWCGVKNRAVGFRDPRDKSKFWDLDDPAGDAVWDEFDTDEESRKAVIQIVLTIAHLGVPVEFPFHLHVTATAQTDEVIWIVGFGMSRHAEGLERLHVVNDGALPDGLAIAAADRAGLFVSLPHCPPGGSPGGSVISCPSASPIWIRLTRIIALSKPLQSAGVRTEPPSSSKVVPANIVGLAATNANSSPEPAPNAAVEPIPADLRAGFRALLGLLSSKDKFRTADNADRFAFVASGRPAFPGELMPESPIAAERIPAFHRACFSGGIQRCRCSEHVPARYTDFFGGAESWARHTYIVACRRDLDHDPRNNDSSNLAALCQRCHLRHDAVQHASNARKTRHRKAGQLTLDMETG